MLWPLWFSASIIRNYLEDFGVLHKLFTQTKQVQSTENYAELAGALLRNGFSIWKKVQSQEKVYSWRPLFPVPSSLAMNGFFTALVQLIWRLLSFPPSVFFSVD